MSDKLTNELLPCPFCGGAAGTSDRASNETKTGHIWFVFCHCGGHTAHAHQHADTKEGAIAAWNRRARLPNAQGEVVAWMVTTSQWPTIQDEEVRFVHHMEGLKQNERWTPLYTRPAPSTLPDSLPDAVPAFIMKAIERELEDAEHPKGMSTHDGRTRILASHVRYLLRSIDALRAHMGRK